MRKRMKHHHFTTCCRGCNKCQSVEMPCFAPSGARKIKGSERVVEVRYEGKPIKLDSDQVFLLNTFAGNQAGSSLESEAQRVYRMFENRFPVKSGSLNQEDRDYLAYRQEGWKALVSETYGNILSARCEGVQINTMRAMTALSKFLKETESVLKLI